MGKRGQTTAFIIVALVIVVFGILIYFFYPQITSIVGLESEPSTFLSNCVEQDVQEGIDILSKQGGYVNPEGFITYKGQNVKYLCYTTKYFEPCFVQQPLLREHFENELEEIIEKKADECVGELKTYYEKRGYDVSNSGATEVSVDIIPDNVRVIVKMDLTLSKENTQRFNDFQFETRSKMYSLLMTATSIIDFESTYGDSEPLSYTQYYPNLRIEKDKLGDGSTIYTVSDVTSDESFTFASRSLAWDGGYGL